MATARLVRRGGRGGGDRECDKAIESVGGRGGGGRWDGKVEWIKVG